MIKNRYAVDAGSVISPDAGPRNPQDPPAQKLAFDHHTRHNQYGRTDPTFELPKRFKAFDQRDILMYLCPHCARSLDLRRAHEVPTLCPFCGEELPHELNDRWTDVARVTNLAEAGFLTDELNGLGIEAQIYQLEEFSAITDRWVTVYLIRVPSSVARQAAAQIRSHLAEEVDEAEASALGFRFSADGQTVDPLFWRPVALVVLAGVASFLLGQRFSEQNVERRPPGGSSLPVAVGAIGRPFVTEPTPGEPQYRLSLDRRRKVWNLDADRDGDGVFDTRHQFQANAAGW
jgi:hypothetical protein